MACSQCGTDAREGDRFCASCGAELAPACPGCAAPLEPGDRFCGQCGRATSTGVATETAARPPIPGPAAERRQVSVLFVDLVGFTSLAEHRDPEAVRELLSTYFEHARTVIGRYGGTIEKFIGDAVMAVWGTPVAHEDDAERAVRAGLDLVEGVSLLGEQIAFAGLQGRAGVVTGEAAVRLDAVDQGMVAGDVVNTAARLQSIAAPGQVMVDEGTRATTSRAIAYAEAGEHELKGRVDRVQVFAALQVVAGSGGAQRFDGLEPPFVGRERDLKMLKELLHDTIERARPQLVVVSGTPGIGKSRLGWEFFKYVDGIEQLHYWHTGRCLAYGEGVAFWALAEMVRGRFRIAEGDEGEVLRQKLDDGLLEHVDDPDERAWLRPRLAALLGIGDPGTAPLDRDSLFAGWRLLFERLAARAPVVLVFEDVQDADDGLLDFLDHLVQSSMERPVFVLALARPEVHERRPAWGRQRGVTLLQLDRVPDVVVERMVRSMVDGLPDPTVSALAVRAEGTPLYAVETVRMLIDRDVVVPRGGRYVLARDVGDVDDLGVPPTLQALVAARLDELPDFERRLVRSASVLGQSFTPDAVASVVAAAGDLPADELDLLLRSLVDREVLMIRRDPRSAEAGQYAFVENLMQAVALQRLSRDDRKVLHLAAAAHLEQTHELGDIAGVIASHYLGAAEARPEDVDAPELRATAIRHLQRAGDRARGLAAIDEALRYYERALGLCEDDAARARLAEAAGAVGHMAARLEPALEHLRQARTLYATWGDRAAVARAASWEVEVLMDLGRFDEALQVGLAAWSDDEDLGVDGGRLAAAIAMLGVNNPAVGEPPGPWLERAAEAAERSGAWEVLGRALSLKGTSLAVTGRRVEGEALTAGAYQLAQRHGLHHRAAIQAHQLFHAALERDLDEARGWAEAANVHARRSGDRFATTYAADGMAQYLFELGDWDDIDVVTLRELYVRASADNAIDAVPMVLLLLAVWRGELALLEDGDPLIGADSSTVGYRAPSLLTRALLADRDGQPQIALPAAQEAVIGFQFVTLPQHVHVMVSVAVSAAIDLDRVEEAQAWLREVRSEVVPTTASLAHDTWAQARFAAHRGEPADLTEDGFLAATRAFRDLARPFWVARVLLDHAEWVAGVPDLAPRALPLATEALEIFRRLGAAPFAGRAMRVADQGVST